MSYADYFGHCRECPECGRTQSTCECGPDQPPPPTDDELDAEYERILAADAEYAALARLQIADATCYTPVPTLED
jgi:hypothetical protein